VEPLTANSLTQRRATLLKVAQCHNAAGQVTTPLSQRIDPTRTIAANRAIIRAGRLNPP
jgi:hypothetical protein